MAYFTVALVALAALSLAAGAASSQTWAQKLGWGANDRVLIVHADDVGMCHSTNLGATAAYECGIVSSMSVMMPCPHVGEIADYLREHPETDAGLHLTLTSEWPRYRWGPVAGAANVPGLTDERGRLWQDGDLVLRHAPPDEVEIEIRAQLDRALECGISPTHMDSHMAVLFLSREYFTRYVKVAAEHGLPILAVDMAPERYPDHAPYPAQHLKAVMRTVWNAGLPVIDDVRAETYGWPVEERRAEYIKLLRGLAPGITEVIVHCAADTTEMRTISDDASRWIADGRIMLDPGLRNIIEDEGIILTTWRELKVRRDAAAS
ncbi:MAG: polysaccharide deacetylase family protein [Armatimonadota bacterium]|nr:MAG: polysaccharide deacetylase family protein [Armatimonadota bacterium]